MKPHLLTLPVRLPSPSIVRRKARSIVLLLSMLFFGVLGLLQIGGIAWEATQQQSDIRTMLLRRDSGAAAPNHARKVPKPVPSFSMSPWGYI